MRHRDQFLVPREVGEAQHRKPALARAEDFAGAAQSQILLGDTEPVLGLAQNLETPLGDRTQR